MRKTLHQSGLLVCDFYFPVFFLEWSYLQGGALRTFKLCHHPKHILAVLAFGVFGAMGAQLTYFITVDYSNAATASVLQYLSPVIVAITLSIQFKKWPTRTMRFAILLAFIGVFLLTTHGSLSSLAITPAALIWGIASAFAAAFYAIFPSRLIKTYGILSTIGWGMLLGGIVLSILYPPWQTSGRWDITSIVLLVYSIIFGGGMAFYLFLRGVQKIGGGKASILLCSEPLAAILLSVLLLGLGFTLLDWIGSLSIVVTIVILGRAR